MLCSLVPSLHAKEGVSGETGNEAKYCVSGVKFSALVEWNWGGGGGGWKSLETNYLSLDILCLCS